MGAHLSDTHTVRTRCSGNRSQAPPNYGSAPVSADGHYMPPPPQPPPPQPRRRGRAPDEYLAKDLTAASTVRPVLKAGAFVQGEAILKASLSAHPAAAETARRMSEARNPTGGEGASRGGDRRVDADATRLRHGDGSKKRRRRRRRKGTREGIQTSAHMGPRGRAEPGQVSLTRAHSLPNLSPAHMPQAHFVLSLITARVFSSRTATAALAWGEYEPQCRERLAQAWDSQEAQKTSATSEGHRSGHQSGTCCEAAS